RPEISPAVAQGRILDGRKNLLEGAGGIVGQQAVGLNLGEQCRNGEPCRGAALGEVLYSPPANGEICRALKQCIDVAIEAGVVGGGLGLVLLRARAGREG